MKSEMLLCSDLCAWMSRSNLDLPLLLSPSFLFCDSMLVGLEERIHRGPELSNEDEEGERLQVTGGPKSELKSQ